MPALPAQMTAIAIRAPGAPDMLVPEQRPLPRPGEGEVLLRMHAAAIGLRDYKVVTGAYGDSGQRRPLIPGGEGVGEVVELGPGVRDARVGDRVNPTFVQQWRSGRPTNSD